MTKETQTPFTVYSGHLSFDPSENKWQSKSKVFYKVHHTLKSTMHLFTIHFSEKGDILSTESEDRVFSNEIFAKIQHLDPFNEHVQYCKDVIKSVETIRCFTPRTFESFHYDSNRKGGYFRFKNSSVQYAFTLYGGTGLDEISISYGNIQPDQHDIFLYQKAIALFGNHGTSKLNELIKQKIKLRYFF